MVLFFERALLPAGWTDGVRITIIDSRIAAIETGASPLPGDDLHGCAVPGVANLHSHAFQRAMAGRTEVAGPDGDDFWTWREAMYRLAGRIDPDALQDIAAFAFAEMLAAGFTSVAEFHYLHNDRDGTPFTNIAEMSERLIAATVDTGIGMTLLPVLYAHGGFGGVALGERQRRFGLDPQGYGRLLARCRQVAVGQDGVRIGLAAHSLRAVTPAELAELITMDSDCPIHIHIAEQTGEVEAAIAHLGARPVEWLLTNAAVDRRWCLVHATHVTPAERSGIAASGAVVGLCPITEANLGDGIFPAAEFAAERGRFGIGSDSNVEISLAGELRLLEYGQRLLHRGRNVMAGGAGRATARSLFDAALAGGAQALGNAVGGLAIGAPADLVTLRGDDCHGDELLSAWLFSGDGATMVDRVWARGRLCVVDGRHVRRDELALRYRRRVQALFA